MNAKSRIVEATPATEVPKVAYVFAMDTTQYDNYVHSFGKSYNYNDIRDRKQHLVDGN